jgi:hypothetical protein
MKVPVIYTIDLMNNDKPVVLRLVKNNDDKRYWETYESPHCHFEGIALEINALEHLDKLKQYVVKQTLFCFLACNKDIDLRKLRIDPIDSNLEIFYFMSIDEHVRIPVFAKQGQKVFCSLHQREPCVKFIF